MTEHDLEGNWLVVGIRGETVGPEPSREIRFEADRITGRVGVNRFTGKITVVGDLLQVGPVASTRMAGAPELMALEDRFTSHLEGEHEIALENGVLTLGQGNQTIVITRRVG